MKILVTGSAGFIGHHLVLRLATEGHEITGLDNLNKYYNDGLKPARLVNQGFKGTPVEGVVIHSVSVDNLRFIKADLGDKEMLLQLFSENSFDAVIHLAAQAGVRYSLENPQLYIDSNVTGFMNILEACRHHPVKHLVFASSSSVYGMNPKFPFRETDDTSNPISLYAATKKSNELMAHTYAHLFSIPVTGLRFFTVYGPWGRPDMALFLFTKAIYEGTPIRVFNQGDMKRDFTYVDDITESITRLISLPPSRESSHQPGQNNIGVPFNIFNIGNHNPVSLGEFIAAIEKATGRKAIKTLLPIQPGDVQATYADVSSLSEFTGFQPQMGIEEGVKIFVSWYRDFYRMDRKELYQSLDNKTDAENHTGEKNSAGVPGKRPS